MYAASGNTFLQENLEGIAHKARPIGMQITPILSELLSDHRSIVSALRQRDPIRAETASREHIRRMLALFTPAEKDESAITHGNGEYGPEENRALGASAGQR
jgi:DNA-binding GntR family transcriptional regulator